MNARRCAGGLEPALTLALIASLLSGCLRFNELGPDPLLDGLQSLLIKQADGGYQAISLCSSDRFLIDGDLEALGFKASLRELGLSHGSKVPLGQHILPFAAQPLVWSQANQQWSEGPSLGAQAPRLQLPDLRTSMIECAAERPDADVAHGWFSDLRRVAGTHEGAVMRRDPDTDERFWMSVAVECDGCPPMVKSQGLDGKVLDVAASDAGNIWLAGNELRADRDGRTFTTILPGAPPLRTPLIAQDKSGTRVAVLIVRGASGWFLIQYDWSAESDFTVLRDAPLPLPVGSDHPADVSSLAFTPAGDVIGVIRRTGVFTSVWADGATVFEEDNHTARVKAVVQLVPGRYASVAVGTSKIMIRDSSRESDVSCATSLVGTIAAMYSVGGRLVLVSDTGLIDASGGGCTVVRAGDFSDVGEVLGFAVLPNRSCESGEPSLVLSPAQFGSTSDSCYNQQVTARIDDL